MKILHLEGKVFSGKGEGAEYIRFNWVRKQIEKELGFIPYDGTLNIQLEDEYIVKKKALTETSALEIVPRTGYCGGKMFKAILNDCLMAAVVVPNVPRYPENVVEVVSSENLRKTLGLSDGDKVDIGIIF